MTRSIFLQPECLIIEIYVEALGYSDLSVRVTFPENSKGERRRWYLSTELYGIVRLVHFDAVCGCGNYAAYGTRVKHWLRDKESCRATTHQSPFTEDATRPQRDSRKLRDDVESTGCPFLTDSP